MTQSIRAARPAARRASPMPLIWMGLLLGVILIAVGLLGLGKASNQGPGIVDFTLNDFSGHPVRLSDYRGQPVLVNLWATWCPPCRAEMPDLARFYAEHQSKGLVVLAVDTMDNPNAAAQFIRDQNLPFVTLYDPEGKVQRVFGSDALPSTFLIDRSGRTRFAWTGQISPSTLQTRVVPLLSE